MPNDKADPLLSAGREEEEEEEGGGEEEQEQQTHEQQQQQQQQEEGQVLGLLQGAAIREALPKEPVGEEEEDREALLSEEQAQDKQASGGYAWWPLGYGVGSGGKDGKSVDAAASNAQGASSANTDPLLATEALASAPTRVQGQASDWNWDWWYTLRDGPVKDRRSNSIQAPSLVGESVSGSIVSDFSDEGYASATDFYPPRVEEPSWVASAWDFVKRPFVASGREQLPLSKSNSAAEKDRQSKRKRRQQQQQQSPPFRRAKSLEEQIGQDDDLLAFLGAGNRKARLDQALLYEEDEEEERTDGGDAFAPLVFSKPNKQVQLGVASALSHSFYRSRSDGTAEKKREKRRRQSLLSRLSSIMDDPYSPDEVSVHTSATRRSSARWSAAHPVKSDETPAKYRGRRFFRRFIPGRGKARVDLSGQRDDHLVHLNKPSENADFPKNLFITSKYTALNFVFKNLGEQFNRVANRYFLLITLMQLVPGVTPFPLYITVAPLMFILGVTAVKEAYEDVQRHKADNRVNSMRVVRLDPVTGSPTSVKSKVLGVGDIIAVDRDTVAAADIVVLATEHAGSHAGSPICWADTANLDGETRLKVRRAVDLSGFLPGVTDENQPEASELNELQAVITSDKPNPWIEAFSGRMDSTVAGDEDTVVQLSRENMIVRGAVLRNTKRVWGVIVGAGPLTKLRLNQQLPAFKMSSLEKALNTCLAIVFAYQTLLCIGLAWAQVLDTTTMSVLGANPDRLTWADYNWNTPEDADPLVLTWVYAFLTWFILCSFMVPMSLYIILEIGKLTGGLYIHWDAAMYSRDGLRRPARPNTTSLVEELGSVQYILSDKTGTLTDNEMRFTHCGTSKATYVADYPSAIECVGGRSIPVLRRDTPTKRSSASSSASGSNSAAAGKQVLPQPSSASRKSAPGGDSDLQELMFIMAACNELEIEIPDTAAAPPSPSGKKKKHGQQKAASKEMVAVAQAADEPGAAAREYSGESPDEVALADTSRDFGFVLESRTPNKVVINMNGSDKVFALKGLLPFNSTRKRMAVVLQGTSSSKVHVLYKGADNIMFELVGGLKGRHKERVSILEDQVHQFSKLGLRTLVMASCTLDADSSAMKTFLAAYETAQVAMEDRDGKIGAAFDALEPLLKPVGCTGVEDKLSDGVEDALQSLVAAGVQVAVLTGDKTETAFSIATSCGLFRPGSIYHMATEPDAKTIANLFSEALSSPPTDSGGSKAFSERINDDDDDDDDDGAASIDLERASPPPGSGGEALVISGECLRVCMEDPSLSPMLVAMMQRCYTTVCTRMTPKQKAAVTKLVREKFNRICLSIGDGANDVSMIREANVGVGVFGKEGSQAVNSADFAIHKFADLKRLLFVHGAGCRLRITTAARASLFCNMGFNMPQAFFGYFSVYSGQSIETANILTVVNLLLTSPLIMTICCFDRALLPDDLVSKPYFYQPFKPVFTVLQFMEEMGYAFWNAIVAFLVGFAAAKSSVWVSSGVVAGMWAEGTLLTGVVVHANLVNVTLRVNSWTYVHYIFAAIGFLNFWIFLVGLSEIWSPETTDNGYVLSGYLSKGAYFWVAFALGTVACTLPYYAVKAYKSIWRPTPTQIFLEAKHKL